MAYTVSDISAQFLKTKQKNNNKKGAMTNLWMWMNHRSRLKGLNSEWNPNSPLTLHF